MRWIKLALILLMFASLLCILVGCSDLKPKEHYIDFYEPLCIRPHINYTYHTCNEFNVQVDEVKITIPKAFDTDLASIPRWYWSFMAPSNSAIMAPAVLHDYLYGCPADYSRKEIDEIFYAALITNGTSSWNASKMYYAVRLFGSLHYHPSAICTVPSLFD